MLKTIILLIGMIMGLCPGRLWADTHTAVSCAYTHVLDAVNAASPGDTVRVPEGNATWSTGLLITKGICLIGAGIGKTNITMSAVGGLGYAGHYCIQYNPGNWSLNTPFRFSGFTFDLGGVSCWFALGVANKTQPFTIQDKIRIDHNRVVNPLNTSASMFFNYCEMYGVVDNNVWSGCGYPLKNDTQGGPDMLWDTYPHYIWAPGTNQSLYFEDNLVELAPYQGAGDNTFCDGQYSGRYVVRYNDITGAQSYSLFDLHGHNGTAMGGCFGAEIYGNDITCSTGWSIRMLVQRSGQSTVFCNNVNMTASGYFINYAYQTSGSSPDICPTLHPELQITHDTYSFQNRRNTNGVLSTIAIGDTFMDCAGLTGIPTAGRDFMGDETSPGVTAGPLALRSENPIIHQGYFATDQSTSTLSGRVGIAPPTPINGTLYYCKSNGSWTNSYSPYTYPHPLRTSGPLADCSITITAPNGGESWRKGETRQITWNANGVSGNLVIELVRNGSVIGAIASSVAASAGSFPWTVSRLQNGTFITGTNLKIRISTTTGTVLAEQHIGSQL